MGLVRSHQHRGAAGDRLGDDLAENGSRIGIEPGMGLVEEPQVGTTRDQLRQRDATALAGGESTHRRPTYPPSELEPIEHGVDGG